MSNLWIISELFPPDETSTAFILGEIANVMAKRYNVKVISGPEIYDKRKNKDSKNSFKLDKSIEIIRVGGSNRDKNRFLGKAIRFIVISKQLYQTAKKNIQEGDKVLLVTNPAPIVPLISKIRKKKEFELNILVHDVFPENLLPAGIKLPKLFYNFLKKIFDKAYSRADKLIAIGRDMRRILNDKVIRFNNNPNISIIENWADLDIVSPVDFTPDTNKIIIEYAGNIGRVQGLQSMIEEIEIANNKNLEFHLWGTGAEENNLKAFTSSHQMKNVIFHGAYRRAEQVKVLNSCHLALVTLSEGMYGLGVPSKTYNIMAAGKAILFIGDKESEIGLLVKEKGIGYIFEPTEKESIINFLKSLSVERIPEFKEIGIRAREVAEKEYSKETILDKYVKEI